MTRTRSLPLRLRAAPPQGGGIPTTKGSAPMRPGKDMP
ncbi:hypothetical protein Salmuc_00114 [Salipiger mucosus DSM 16094]|uniref:Uncharacterized protein n=1 Tax=Salipiger mucosus DSM 16094 TaxID=1123237 RepID=S9Q8P5_9RHOB|nr:hypothetical protein Salmuc_00114 [Salipiger mucosus DSM 16094]